MVQRRLHEENRRAWNAATQVHNSHKRDQATYLREGGTTVFPEEIELLGDISGKRLLHLQCNAGQDTLSLARLGADVTGVDISDEAIAFATALSTDSGIPAKFARADVYDWLEAAQDRLERTTSSSPRMAALGPVALGAAHRRDPRAGRQGCPPRLPPLRDDLRLGLDRSPTLLHRRSG